MRPWESFQSPVPAKPARWTLIYGCRRDWPGAECLVESCRGAGRFLIKHVVVPIDDASLGALGLEKFAQRGVERFDLTGRPAREDIHKAGSMFRIGVDTGVAFRQQHHGRHAVRRENVLHRVEQCRALCSHGFVQRRGQLAKSAQGGLQQPV